MKLYTVVERGTHTELLAEGGLYRHLYELHFERMEPSPSEVP